MKKVIIIVMGLLAGYAALARVAGEHYYFKGLSIRDGLSQNTVQAILQDKTGFLWFGSKDGLNRYDGNSFRQFKRDADNPRSIGNNFISSLYQDVEGNIWVGTDMGVYIYSPEGDSFHHFMQTTQEGTRLEHAVSMIGGDARGRVWVAVDAQGLFCYDPHTRVLRHCDFSQFSFITSNVKCFAFDDSGTLWIGFYGGGLYYSRDDLQTLHPYLSPDGQQEVFSGNFVTRIIPGVYNCLYVGSAKGGVQELNLTSGRLRDLLTTDENGETVYCRDLLMVSDYELWMGTESGLYIYNLRTDTYTHLSSSAHDPYSLSDNAIYSLCKDKEGGIWIGSYFGGINYYPPSYTYFEKHYPKGTANSLHGKWVREFCADKQGMLWIGTEDGGLNRFNPRTREFSFFAPSAAFTNIHGLCFVDDYLWVGTFAKGLKVVDPRTGTVVKTYVKTDSPRSLIDNSIFAICRTASGEVYLGTMFGLLRYNQQSDDFDRIPDLDGKFVYDVKEDSRGNLWLATYADGAYCYDVNKKKWHNYVHDENTPGSLPYNKVVSIFEDSRRQIWLATQGGGFCRFNPATETFVCYSSRDGLPNDVVYQIAEDKEGMLWLTTNSGLVCFNPLTAKMKVYTTANGLLSNQFNYRSGFTVADGTLYLGCIDGFISFKPATFAENKYLPPVVITDFSLFSKVVHAGEPGSPLEKSITFSDTLVLRADQNSFSFRIAALGYQAPGMNKLRYKLEGFDDDWLPLGESPVVTYANLKYGEYVFQWSSEQMPISRNPSRWNTCMPAPPA